MVTSGRQGLSFHGNWNGDEGTEKNSNFYHRLNRIQVEDPRITKWMNKKQMKYTSPDIQNEMLKVNISYFLEIQKTYFPSELNMLMHYAYLSTIGIFFLLQKQLPKGITPMDDCDFSKVN